MSKSSPNFPASTNIYEVNIRQYTPEGTFRAFMRHLPRLMDMGVEVLWLMPIHPIGLKNRKGGLGSYYSIQDFKGINPEFGNEEDLRALIHEAHKSGMRVLLDWVANHAAFDNVWTMTHPSYFERDVEGNFVSPYDWSDVIQINHHSEEQREAMIDCMRYWVREFNIDGFRADLAHLTPLSFWIQARHQLDAVKSGLIWLAETENPEYHQVFDISFTWQWMHAAENICKGKAPVRMLAEVLEQYRFNFPATSYRLFFSSNHDENSWNGTEFEKYGEYAKLLAVFSYTYASIPLLYGGQEIPNPKRLSFFEKDSLQWPEVPAFHQFYKTLNHLRRQHPALSENHSGSNLKLSLLEESVLTYMRQLGESGLFTALNFGAYAVSTEIIDPVFAGNWENVFSGDGILLNGKLPLSLEPGEFLLIQKK